MAAPDIPRLEVDVHAPAALDSLTEAELDRLPVGAIRVDADGGILFYSRTEGTITGREPQRVLGRNFFRDVAPCTAVPEFYGRFRRGVLQGSLNCVFDFVFDFDMHPVRVHIAMREADKPGEYWILVRPLEHLPPRDADAARALLERKYQTTDSGGTPLRAMSVDFSQCDAEPIRHCASLQPYGCLLVLDPSTDRVIAAGANTERLLGQAPEAVLGAKVEELLPAGDGGLCACLAARRTNRLEFCPNVFRAPPQPRRSDLHAADLALDLRLTPWRKHLLLELEPHAAMGRDVRFAGFDFAAFGLELSRLADVEAVCERTVQVVRHLSRFERVLAYRFEPNCDGIVIAEDLAPGTLPSVLGLRYPAEDIPRQARALYAEVPLRYAPSRDHIEVPLLAHDADPGAIDIGAAQLRTPSPLHRAYLERFGVNGSLTLSIVCDGHLWGLVTCHHRRPHPVTFALRRRLVELITLASARVALLDERARLNAREQGMAAINGIIGRIDVRKPFPQGFLGNEALLRGLLGADSMQIFHRDLPLVDDGGPRLTAAEQQVLLRFLRGRGGGVWSTDCLSGELEPAAGYAERLAGVIAVFIGPAEEYVMLFGRGRSPYTVRWGSDPAGLPGFILSTEPAADPTQRVWTERRTHHARPWSAVELGTAEALRSLTQEVIVASATHFEVLALRDGLTGLSNRERFRQLLAATIDQAAATGAVFGVGLLDIDHFKTINDTLGHDKGDVLLVAAAKRIVAALPDGAVVARLGGDEFAVLLPSGHEDALDAMPERIVESFRKPIIVGEDRFAVTVSMGITLGHGGSAGTELLKQADMALYQAKGAGRNRVRAFDSGLQQRALARLEVAREVLGRTPEAAVEILLQPQVPITAAGGTPRYEVLARWRTADGRLLQPLDFIDAAQQNGLIRAVTTSVLRRTVALLRAQPGDGDTGPVLSANVAAADLEARWFARSLLDDLAEAGVAPARLELEVAEAVFMRVTPSVEESLRQLAEGGVRIALDDFGSGFSSMAHLRELAIDTFKIDRAFIRGVTAERDRRLVAGMVAMAHSLGKIVVAEGVERVDELATLRRLGCDWGQGYLWSEPLPPEQALHGQWRPAGAG
ncbi:MAG: EAL domain-containing protein [Thiohalocapsa sp.]|uniref:EAL domain-containing protein n=1 Tax=Thiohalocapsa sp. TaxID=2497641 RepID=UPI0025E82C3C|nr:EAL domain-containing protein [Thiohalocapsa sp.]MCG6942794.1 EAL domain-containing protein [Thiohalocapsa sp.]